MKKPIIIIISVVIGILLLIYAVVPTVETGISHLSHTVRQQDQIIKFGSQAATAVFTYDYTNYDKNLDAASNYFSPDAWKAFYAALTATHNLDEVQDKKLTVTAKVTGFPVVLKHTIFLDQGTWLIQIPITVTYLEPSTHMQTTQFINAKLLIIQTISTNTLSVAQFVAELKKQ